jgi:hypothetical protein
MLTLSLNVNINYTNKINFQWFIFYKFILNSLLQNLKINSNYYFSILKLFSTSQKIPNFSQHNFKNPMISRNVESKFYYQLKTQRTQSIITKHRFAQTNNYNLFLLYFQQTTNHSSSFFKPHTYFKQFFIISNFDKSPVLNVSKFYSKWTNTYNLLTNLFFLKTSLLIFSNKIFKNETISFNWSRNLLSYNLFKYSSPIFFLKDTKYGVTSTLIFKRLEQKKLNVSFLTDIKYHEKNLYYLKRFHIYTIGLVPYNLNPWVVSYSIPTSLNSLWNQYFFINFLSLLSQSSEKTNFNEFKNLWYRNI